MTITTKYSIGEEVYFITKDFKIAKGLIHYIRASTCGRIVSIVYRIGSSFCDDVEREEVSIFKTKKELLEFIDRL